MDDPFALIGVISGIALVVAYGRKFWPNPDYLAMVSILPASVGIFAGLKLCWFSFFYAKTFPINQISLQLFFGGFALCCAGVLNINHRFKP
jgi:hypothetical protein